MDGKKGIKWIKINWPPDTSKNMTFWPRWTWLIHFLRLQLVYWEQRKMQPLVVIWISHSPSAISQSARSGSTSVHHRVSGRHGLLEGIKPKVTFKFSVTWYVLRRLQMSRLSNSYDSCYKFAFKNFLTSKLNSSAWRRWRLCLPSGMRWSFDPLMFACKYSGWNCGTKGSFWPCTTRVGQVKLLTAFVQMSPPLSVKYWLIPSIQPLCISWRPSLPYNAKTEPYRCLITDRQGCHRQEK